MRNHVYSRVAVIMILSMLVGCGEIFHKSSDPLKTQSIPFPTDSGKPVMLLIIVLAVNERMAYVYLLDKRMPLVQIVKLLQTDVRMDVIAWKEGEGIHVMAGSKDGQLSFRRNGNYIDPYRQT
ncbi:hypothetical protein P9597_30820 [Aneurinibacillus migulanus]|uniref:hypothetical protein n=1 Tax=Aneurinibacillus migulanus TaxID=47500 RepID=UPI002E1DACFC|nr:hypothetical protein [Aneurinibacillus migulanus]